MKDVSQWTLADAIQRIPLNYWWGVAGVICTVFAAGYWVARVLQSRKLENLEADVAAERATPKLSIVLGAADKDVGNIAHILRYGFSRSEYIHPEIVEELDGWISDELPVYAAVDLEGAMRSNRFSLPAQKRGKPSEDGWVRVEKKSELPSHANPYYMYKFIGVTQSGTNIIQTASSGGGTGSFCRVLFMRFQTDDVLTSSLTETRTRRRILLRCIGERPLGDRYDGEVTYADGVLTIGAGSRIDMGRVPVQDTRIQVE